MYLIIWTNTCVRTFGVLYVASIIGRPILDYFSDTVHQTDHHHSALSLCSPHTHKTYVPEEEKLKCYYKRSHTDTWKLWQPKQDKKLHRIDLNLALFVWSAYTHTSEEKKKKKKEKILRWTSISPIHYAELNGEAVLSNIHY